MTSYLGNLVSYGSGASWRVREVITNTAATTASTVNVTYQLWADFSSSISDTSNTVSWHIAGNNFSANNFSFVGSGSILVYEDTFAVTIVYGSTTPMAFSFTVDNIASGSTGPSTVSGTYTLPARLAGPPSTPAAPTISAITAHGCRVSYTDPANNGATITNHVVQIDESDFTSPTVSEFDTASPYDTTALARYTTYRARVRAINSAGNSNWSAQSAPFTTLAEIPVMGTAYSATAITRNSAKITGLSVTDNGGQAPTDARVQYNTTPSATGATVKTNGSWGDVTLTGLAASTTYYYRAAAANSAGWSAYPASWKPFTTLSDAPDDMAAPTFTAVTNTSFQGNWVAPAANGATITGYYYELASTADFATIVTTGTTTALNKSFTGLTPGTKYWLRVRANATPNNGGFGSASQQTTGIAPLSGMRVYAGVPGVGGRLGELYYAVPGVGLRKVRPMWAHGGVLETE